MSEPLSGHLLDVQTPASTPLHPSGHVTHFDLSEAPSGQLVKCPDTCQNVWTIS